MGRSTAQYSGTRLRLAVFDLDGTLVELDREHFVGQIAKTLEKLGLFCPVRTVLRELVRGHAVNSMFSAPGERERFWAHYEEGELPPPRAFSRAVETVDALVSRGMAVAIATARKSHCEEVRQQLHPTGLTRHTTIISTFHGSDWTDKIEQLRGVCRDAGVKPVASLMVGDSEDDMRSSLHVGFPLRLAIGNGAASHERLRAARPSRILSCISEVPGALDEHHSLPAVES